MHWATSTLALVLAVSASGAELPVIRVATVSPLSGAQAAQGETVKLGAQLAVEEERARFEALGFRLELTPQDDQASPDMGRTVARRLSSDPELLAVVGHFNSGVAIPASDIYRDHGLALVSPVNSHPRLTDRGYDNVNRICGRDDVQGPVGAEYAVQDLKARRILVLHDKTAYGQGVASDFRARAEALGAAIAGFVGTEERANFQSVILQIRALKPDLVYFGGIYDQGGLLLRQLREKGAAVNFMGPDGIDSAELVKIAGPAANGVYYTTVAGPTDQFPQGPAFAARYQARFGREADACALYAYDATRVALAGIAAAAADGAKPAREAVCRAIRGLRFDGVTGAIAFNANGDRTMADYYVAQVERGAYPGAVRKVLSFPPPADEPAAR